MSVNQETCSTALKKCQVKELPGFVEHLVPVIGKAGGRRFREQNPPLQGTLSMKDVVKRLDTVWKDLSKDTNALDRKSVEAVLNTVTKIQDKDKEADVKLKEKNILIRMFTAIRSFFGNIRFNRADILKSIEKGAKEKLAVKADPTQAEESIVGKEAKIEALILTMSKLNEDNYAETKKFLENSPDEIVCAAIRRSINNNEYGSFIGTMSSDKLESVFKTAAQEARDSNDYQLFALLATQVVGTCSKQTVVDVIKHATNGSEDKIDIIRLDVNKRLKDNDMWLQYYESVFKAARA